MSENFKSISFYHSERGQNHLLKGVERLQTVPAMASSKNLIEERPILETDPLHLYEDDMDSSPIKLALDPDYILPSSPEQPHRFTRH